jgi:hypothetical protein
MLKLIKNVTTSPLKDLIKGITENQGGQWVQKKELRIKESEFKRVGKHNLKSFKMHSL